MRQGGHCLRIEDVAAPERLIEFSVERLRSHLLPRQVFQEPRQVPEHWIISKGLGYTYEGAHCVVDGESEESEFRGCFGVHLD